MDASRHHSLDEWAKILILNCPLVLIEAAAIRAVAVCEWEQPFALSAKNETHPNTIA